MSAVRYLVTAMQVPFISHAITQLSQATTGNFDGGTKASNFY
jgi:hypothetical protein